jgi:hypothetical protein
VSATLASIYRHNFRHDFFDHPHAQRIYALEDEKGLLLCSWPRGGRPALPFVYADEVWTGIEYQVAAHLIYAGQVAEGLAMVRAVRDRYDGRRRNPWNEVECGSHYARALSSWSLVTALSGFTFSAPERRLGFAPRVSPRDFRCFFTTGDGWGCPPAHRGKGPSAGSGVRQARSACGTSSCGTKEAGRRWRPRRPAPRVLAGVSVQVETGTLRADFGGEVVIAEGQALSVALRPQGARA